MNRLCLTKKPLGPCPPDGYRYVFPEDGYTAHAWCYTDWINEAVNHLRANNREVPDDLAAQMEEQLCQGLEPGWCSYDSDERPRPNLSLGWNDVVGALETFGNWIKNGCRFVDKTEADRRALICSRCYLNTMVSGCAGCKKIVAEVIGNRTSKYDFALKACGVCKCVLRAKIWFPIKTLDTETEKLQQMYPAHCWLKKNGENFIDA